MKMILAKDIKEVEAGATFFGGTSGRIAKYSTLDECKGSYLNAEGLYEAQKDNIVSVIRATSLKEARILIMGSLWNAPLNKVSPYLVDKWFNFLDSIGEMDKGWNQSAQIKRLMRFARVTETARLKGVTVIIPNEVQLRGLAAAIKEKTRKTASEVDIALLYDKLAKEKNNGKQFEGTDSVVKEYNDYKPKKTKTKKGKDKKSEEKEEKEEVPNVWVRDIFTEDAGECPKRGLNSMALGSSILGKLPSTDAAEWKKWYYKVSRCLHPDHGGCEADMAILTSINNMIGLVLTEEGKTDKANDWESDYEQWKKDKGYESDFIKEDEL